MGTMKLGKGKAVLQWLCCLCLLYAFGCFKPLDALAEDAVIDSSTASEGYCQVSWTAGGSSRIKVMVKGPSGTSYQYNLNTNGSYEVFPLSDGSGQYTVSVYKNVSGDKYSTSSSSSFAVNLVSEFAPFLHANQYVNYSAGSASTAKAGELCGGAADEVGKIGSVYNYVVQNVRYDQGKASTVQSGYLPNVDQTLATGTGICFDYASLTAAMLRSQGIPAKLIVGYAGGAYHAWINVWSNTEGWVDAIHFMGNEWKLMDPTFASSSNSSASIMQYIGDGTNYSMKYQY